MTVEAVDVLTEAEARRLTERIRSALDRVSTAWADLADRISEAYQRRADLALGYGSWSEYAEAELKPSEGLAADVRRQLVGMLRDQGMSTRAIASSVGVSVGQAHADITAPRVQSLNTSAEEFRRRVLTGAETNGRVVALTGPASVATPVVGLDGKTYTRPEPKTPVRRPLRDGFRDASLDLDKIVRRFESLVADDRFPRNKNEVARYANDLIRARDALQRVLDTFN